MVTAILASDWCQKTFVFFCPIRSQNGSDRLELVWWDIVSRGSSRRSLLFFVPYFSNHLDFPTSPLSAPGSPRMCMPVKISEWMIGGEGGSGGGVEVWIGLGGMWRRVSNSCPRCGFYPRKEVSLENYSQVKYQPSVPILCGLLDHVTKLWQEENNIVDTHFEEKRGK